MKTIFQRRFVVAFLGLLVSFVLQSLRLNLGIAMVAMVNDTTSSRTRNNSSSATECPIEELDNLTISKPSRGEFLWSPELQGFIQSAGYVGHVLMQIPGGILAKKFGAKKVLIWGHLIASLTNFLSPIAARTHPYFLLSITLLRGMAQAAKPPSLSVVSAKWFPKTERGFLGAIIYCGFIVGGAVTSPLCGILCDLDFLGGWPLVFYVFGLASAILAVLFYFFYYDNPEKDPWISKKELEHIQSDHSIQTGNINLPTPWFAMITSFRVNIMILSMFGLYWTLFYTVSIHPTYLGTVLHFPITDNGVLTGLPFVPALVLCWFTCFFSYWVANQRKFGVTALRKGTSSMTCLIFVIGMIGVYFARCNKALSVAFMYVTVSSSGFIIGASQITSPDLTPTFCGPLMGYASTIASLSGFIATIMVGYLTSEGQNLTQWGTVFLINAGIILVTGVLYQLFGSAEIQPWDPAYIKPSKEEKSKESAIALQESTKF